MKEYLIDNYDIDFKDYPLYGKFFIVVQYLNKQGKKLSLNAYRNVFKNVDGLKYSINQLAGDEVLYLDAQHNININKDYVNAHLFKPFKLRDSNNKVYQKYVNNDQPIKKFINKNKEQFLKANNNLFINKLFKLIQDNPGLYRSQLVDLYNKKFKKHIDNSFLISNINDLLKNKKIKIQDNENVSSRYARFFDYNFDYNNDIKYKSLKDIIYIIIQDNQGLRKIDIKNAVQPFYNCGMTIIQDKLKLLINDNKIKTVGQNRGSTKYYYTNNYFNEHINGDINISNELIENKLIEIINNGEITTKINILSQLPQNYINNNYKLNNARNVLDNIINKNNIKLTNLHTVKNDKSINNKKLNKKLTTKEAIIRYIKLHPYITKQDVVNQLQRFSSKSIYNKLKEMINNNELKFTGTNYKKSDTKLYLPKELKNDKNKSTKLTSLKAIENYLNDNPNSTKLDIVNNLNQFSNKTIYIKLRELLKANKIKYTGDYNNRNSKISLT